jgi:hypothetical protein
LRGCVLSAKLKRVLENNPGFKLVQQLAAVLDGTCSMLLAGFSPSDAASFKYCPIATADVERSFSIYKNVLSDKRQSLTKENLSRIMIKIFTTMCARKLNKALYKSTIFAKYFTIFGKKNSPKIDNF